MKGHALRKRILSLTLTAAMLIGFIPVSLQTTVHAAEEAEKAPIDQSTYEALGFVTDLGTTSESYLTNQTGGKTTMNEKNEIYLDYQAHKNYGWMLRDNLNFNHPDWSSYGTIGAYKLYGQFNDGSKTDHLDGKNGYTEGQTGGTASVIGSGITSTGSHKSRAYKTSVEFRSSSGKKDMVAQLYVTSGSKRTDWVAKLELLKYTKGSDEKYTTSVTSTVTLGAAPALNEQDMIFQQYFDALYDITAGDFDGDGIDEIAVYFGTNEVRIYDTGVYGTRLTSTPKQTIGASEILKDTTISKEYNADGGVKTQRAAIITLTAGDLKKDFSDDLVITVSMPQGSTENAHKINPYAYIYGYNGSKLAQDEAVRLWVDDWAGNSAENDPQVFKTANATIGDIDGDSCMELVIGGRLCALGGMEDTEWSWGALIPVEYDHGSKSYKVGIATQMELKEYDEGSILIRDGIDAQVIRYRAPVGMAVADLDGTGSDAPYTFFFSELFTYNADTRNFDRTGKYLDTIKNQKNNVDEGEDKGQHWVSDVVVGNFNGNDAGAEQIIAIVACKQDGNTSTDDDWYWYYMSYIAKADGKICRQCEGIINQGRSYINRTDKSRASVFVSIACPDVDNDSIVLEHLDTESFYSKPEVQAVLQSAPYFADVAETYDNYLNNGATAYGTASGSGQGATASVEAHLGAYVDVEFQAGAAADLEAELSVTTSYEHLTNEEVETSVEYSGDAGDDYVVMYTIPYVRYYYNATYPDGKTGILKIEEPLTPATIIVPVETYDAIAKTTEGLEPIRGNILTSTPGDPSSYKKAPKGKWTSIGDIQAITNAGSNSGSLTTVSQSVTNTKEHSFSIGLEESFKIGFGTGAVGNKVTAGISQGLAVSGGGAFSKMGGVAYTGSVDNLPAGVAGYSFNWQLGISETKLNGEDIIVVGYKTTNVKQAPSLPKDISVAAVSSNSATLEWGVGPDAAMYEVFVSGDQNEWLPLEAVPVTYATEDGKIYYTVKGLSSGNVYYFRVNACDGYGVRSLETNPVSVQTLSENSSISVLTQPENTSAALGLDATFKVVAQGNGVSTMYYQWYKRSLNSDGKGYGNWSAIASNDQSCSGATSPTLTVKAVTMDDQGAQYRCRVSQSANYLYTNDAMLTVSKSPTKTDLSLAVGDRSIENGDIVEAASTTVTDETATITSWVDVVNDDGYAKLAASETETGSGETVEYTYTEPYVWTKGGKYYADNNGTVGTEYTVGHIFVNGDKTIATGDDEVTFTTVTLPTAYAADTGTVTSSVSSSAGLKINGTDKYVYIVETTKAEDTDETGKNAADSVVTTYYAATGEHTYAQQKKNTDGDLLYKDATTGEQTTTAEGNTPVMESITVPIYSEVTLNNEASYITIDGANYPVNSFVPYKEKDTKTVVIGQKTEDHAGDILTLRAEVNAANQTAEDKVTFYLENAATGITTTVPAAKQADGTWTASYTFGTAGIYKITAYFSGNDTYFASRSGELLIYVTAAAQSLNIEGGSMTYGQSFNLDPTLFSNIGCKSVSGVSYGIKKDGTAVTGLIRGNTFTPLAAGTYEISASYSEDGSTYTASSTIVVSPRTVTITAPNEKLNVAHTEAERKSAIDGKMGEIVISNILAGDKSALEASLGLYCIAADPSDGYVTNAAGDYSIDVVMAPSADLSSKYNFVFQSGTLTLSQGTQVVTATPGANGSVRISYTTTISDSNGTYTSAPLVVESGTLLPAGANVSITAIPDSGFGIDKWVVDGVIVPGTGMEHTFTLSKDTAVDVYFAYTYNTLNFSSDGNGTVVGAYQGSDTVFNSGDSINANQTVVLSATPAEGYVVSYWTKDGEVVKAEDGTSNYTGNAITVSGVGSSTSYKVYFAAEKTATVTVKFIHKLSETAQEDVLGCGVSFNGEAATSTTNTFTFETTEHDNVTICVDIPGNMLIDHWEKNSKVVANAVEEISVYDISGDLEYIVYCETPNQRVLTFSAELIGANGGDLNDAGTLTVTRNGAQLATGATLPQGAIVNFTATANDGYRVAKWTVNGTTVESVSELTIGDNTSAKVFFEKKPSVEIVELTDNGTVTGFVNGSAIGAYVEFGADVQIDITPNAGYVINTVKVDNNDVTDTLVTPSGTDTDKRYFVIDDVNTNTTVTVTYKAKPVVTVQETEDKGSVTLTATKDFADAIIASGSYVDFGSGLAAVIEPDFGYVVASVSINGVDVALTDVDNSDNKTFAAENIQADTSIAVTYAALDTVKVTFGIVDKNDEVAGGLDGSITASVVRKDMDTYKSTDDSTGELAAVYEGSTVTFTATPETGYKVSKWFVNGEKVSEQPVLTISAGMADQEVLVQFDMVGQSIDFAVVSENENEEAQITATFTPDGSTSAETFASGNKPAVSGVVELTVSGIADGYEIEGWYVNGVKAEGETAATFHYDVSVDVGAEITVKIIRSSYKVTFEATNGTVTAAAGESTVASGDSIVGDTEITFTATGKEPTGYTFKGWTVNGEASDVTEETLTLTLTENITVNAVYELDSVRYAVTYGVIDTNGEDEGGLNGTLKLNGQSQSPAEIRAGSDLTFTAAPVSGYRVAGWYSDAAGTLPIDGTAVEQLTYSTTNLVADMTVYVKFESIPEYTIDLAVQGLGTVTATVNGEAASFTEGKLTVQRYDDVVLTATPAEYQYLVGWTVDEADMGNSLTLTLTDVVENTCVEAAFAASQNVELRTVINTAEGSIKVQAGFDEAGAVIDPTTGILIHKGQNVHLTITPAQGKMVKAWIINDVELVDHLAHEYTIENIGEDTVVEVVFEDLKLHSVPADGEGYTIEDIVETPVDCGAPDQVRDRGNVEFKVVPAYPNVITDLAVTGGEGSTGSAVLNSDGSWTVTVERVTDDIDIAPVVVSGKQLIIDHSAGGSVTVTLNDEIISSSRALSVGDAITIKTVADSGYTCNELTVNGQTFRSGNTYTVLETDASVVINAVFAKLVTGGGGGGIGAVANDIIIVEPENGTITTDPAGKAMAGEEVIITALPASGYKTGTATVTDKDGQEIKLTNREDGSYKFKMPNSKVTVKVSFIVDLIDVTGDEYFSAAVDWAVENGITVGTSATTFSPDMNCTRAQAVTFLWRAAGSPEPKSGAMVFTDVAEGAYYYDAVLWAVEQGITTGTSATTFDPDADCTRAQMLTFLWRAHDKQLAENAENPFVDVNMDAYYGPAVLWAVEEGITNGTSATTFSPDADCTRGQIVTFLWRFFA